MTMCHEMLVNPVLRQQLMTHVASLPEAANKTGKWSTAEQLKELFRGGSANPKIEVVELVTALHPARFFVPLYTPAYGVIARERIENGEPIGFYTGVLQMDTETDEGAVSPYCFTVPASDMDKNWQKDLKIDARERGNELRFINDPRGLPGEANCRSLVVRWKGLPHILFVASKPINPGQELLLNYGEDYWHLISSHLLNSFAHFIRLTRERVAILSKEEAPEVRPNTLVPALPQLSEYWEEARAKYQWINP
jgi:hypothetical protein